MRPKTKEKKIDMIWLILAVIGSSMLSILMRLSERHIGESVSVLAVNYVTCTVLSCIYSGIGNVSVNQGGLGLTLGLGLVNGVLYLSSFVLLQLSVKRNGVVMSTTFMKLGLLVPLVFSMLVFGERMSIVQGIGFVFTIACIVLIHSEKEKTTIQFKVGLILLLLIGGSANGMSKVFEEIGNANHSSFFFAFTFGMACLLCWGLVIYKKEKVNKFHILYGILIGIPNFFSANFLLKSLRTLPAVIAYPTLSVGTIVVVSLVGIFLFKEKLGKRQWVAIVGIMAALVLMNI